MQARILYSKYWKAMNNTKNIIIVTIWSLKLKTYKKGWQSNDMAREFHRQYKELQNESVKKFYRNYRHGVSCRIAHVYRFISEIFRECTFYYSPIEMLHSNSGYFHRQNNNINYNIFNAKCCDSITNIEIDFKSR